MENIKSIIAKNLIKLRKQNKITQIELAGKLNYSDKAVSRWESGEVTPDVETLSKIAEVYKVNIATLFEENLDVVSVEKINKKERGNRAAIILLAGCFIWILATVVYVYAELIMGVSLWEVFCYAVPATFLVALIFSCMWGTKFWIFFFISALVWSIIACIYISFLMYNIWMIFILGAPIQVAIVLWSTIKMGR